MNNKNRRTILEFILLITMHVFECLAHTIGIPHNNLFVCNISNFLLLCKNQQNKNVFLTITVDLKLKIRNAVTSTTYSCNFY